MSEGIACMHACVAFSLPGAGLRVAPAILHACTTARFRGARWTATVPVPTCQPRPSDRQFCAAPLRWENQTLRPRRQILPATALA